MCISAVQQLSGSQAMLQYPQMIFDQAHGNLESTYLTMILGVVSLISSVVCMMLTDCSGRKPLLIISTIGSACSTAMVAAYFHLQYNHVDTNNITWLPAIGVILYRIMHSLGLGAVPSTMAGELFPTNVKALGNMINVIMTSGTAFIVTKLYPIMSENAGVHTPFWIFTACSLVSILFIFFYVPETKGRTLEQIQEKLNGSKQELKNKVLQRIDLPSTNIWKIFAKCSHLIEESFQDLFRLGWALPVVPWNDSYRMYIFISWNINHDV